MTAGDGEFGGGLRERKKAQTRAKLMDAALVLSEKQGYENTTVDQIADAVDVSPRTFTRYFPTKDSVILALLDHLTGAVNVEFARQPADVPPFEALLAASLAMLARASDAAAPMTAQRILSFLRTVNAVPHLQSLAIGLRSQETSNLVAKRLNTSTDDRTVQLISSVWSAIIASAWGSIGTAAGPVIESLDELPQLMQQMLVRTFTEFGDVTRGLSSTY